MRNPDQLRERTLLGKDASIQQVDPDHPGPPRPGHRRGLLQAGSDPAPVSLRRLLRTGAGRARQALVSPPGTGIVAILASARSARLGLEQISGYNPLHLQSYSEYVEAMNGARQDYHWLASTPPPSPDRSCSTC